MLICVFNPEEVMGAGGTWAWDVPTAIDPEFKRTRDAVRLMIDRKEGFAGS